MLAFGFSPDGSRLVTNGADGVRLWPIERDPDGPGERFRLGPPAKVAAATGIAVGTTSWDGSGRLLAVTSGPPNREATVLDLGASSEAIRFEHRGPLLAALSPDGRWLVTFTWKGHQIKVWDVARRALAHEWEATTAYAAFSPDGRWLATSVEGQDCRLWHVDSWRSGPSIPSYGGYPIAFSPDSTMLALNQGRGVQLVDPASGREVAMLESAAESLPAISALSFGPDGRHLTVGTGGSTILLWDLGRVREELSALGLDWDAPPLPPAPGDTSPVRVEVLEEVGDDSTRRGVTGLAVPSRP
jgi:WD40 repeat protein